MAASMQASPAPPQNVQRGNYLWVCHDHSPRGEDELKMKRGDVILLEEMDEEFQDGWWLGEHPGTGQKGLFPAGFTRKAHAHEIPISHALPSYLTNLKTDPAPQAIIASEKTESPSQMEPTTPVESSFASAGSEQTTPQASRHTSTSDVQAQIGSPSSQHRSASSPLPRSSLAADIQQTFRRSIDSHANGEESPVMNETLSVIDEHITDMNTPRHSVSTQEAKTINDSGSEYSSHISHRLSYINGHETDEEESTSLNESEVRRWNQIETARHMRSLGVDSAHCDIFEEQEITGDVLLDMDQDFIFMKEFDFGVMGKRLKTWHKVKAFQEEVKGIKPQQQQTPVRGSIASFAGPTEERSLSRAGHTGPFLPRIPTVSEKTGAGYTPRISAVPGQHPRLASNNSSPMTPNTPPFSHDSPRRVSAASIREFNHSRRHSSIDTTHRGLPDSSLNGIHQKKPSFDRAWTLNSGIQPLPMRPGTSLGTTSEGLRGYRGPQASESEPNTPEQHDDLDRGYFSGTEVDSRRPRRVLQKRTTSIGDGSIAHSRKSSYAEDAHRVNSAGKRQSRIGSVDSMRDAITHVSPAAQVYHGTPPKNRFRSMSTRVSQRSGNDSQSSNPEGKPGFFASFGPLIRTKGDSENSARSSPLHFQLPKMGGAGSKVRRAVGLRAISDVVGKGSNDNSAPVSPRDYDPMSARTGSTTPSATSKSSERHSTDGSGKATEAPGFMIRPRTVKSKKDTSAYTRGLEKKPPKEQIDGCEYSGWMKKRSSNLMTTWKPRLFVLRGRRLSYYYAEDDTEERGLIDITAHRVLRADNDPIIALHATVTGATALPANANTTENAGNLKLTTPAVLSSLTSKDNSGPFFFKLVPPKMNNSRTVQFTKPTTHYFQVDNVKEGRLWMAALMKATIERDPLQVVETTNKQKTISLKQARLMNQRPPALMNLPASAGPERLIEEEEDDHGLRIDGLNLTKAASSEGNSFVDAKVDLHENEPESAPATTNHNVSNPLGEIDVGHPSLLPDPLAKSESK
ncbi:hypothetical protein N7462_010437 [Penicillium macrosclerotiorum]|uniref:uncharacterized protein n=1 Tax=Penicillium macrosclerotiorum TaxID=303699 RepID=UPI0025483966|nr:uncharacterized protein N7462_010437 [Penicillium macrosclerotiorum]KAJ5669367.1 hypothetical protein N7462_010437 [Penicillium macrosclerotiorum]